MLTMYMYVSRGRKEEGRGNQVPKDHSIVTLHVRYL